MATQKKLITKDIFLNSRECLTRGWYLRHTDIGAPPTYSDLFRMNEGMQIGKMARALYPRGRMVNTDSNAARHALTQQLMRDPAIDVIFEATFMHNDVIARADILERRHDGWHLLEVKSGAASDDMKPEYLDDLTYTAFVMSQCGVQPVQSSLMLISKGYRLGMPDKDFFTTVDCTAEVVLLLTNYELATPQIILATGAEMRPIPELIMGCKNCYFYEKTCLGVGIANPVFDLPRLSEPKLSELNSQKINKIEAIPDDFPLTKMQKKVRTSVQNSVEIIDKKRLKILLDSIIFPAFYLDFETVSTAIPLYKNVAPYEEIITQFSVHTCSGLKKSDAHYEFLADENHDDRRILAEKLIHNIGESGSVIVYHAGAETKYLNNLSRLFPDLAPALRAIIQRIVDLKIIVSECYYHPDFHGSFSIKKVLPVLVPDMSYSHLAISDGQTASIIFAELARKKFPKNQVQSIRKNLLQYCGQDTLAMVKIHEKLADMLESFLIT